MIQILIQILIQYWYKNCYKYCCRSWRLWKFVASLVITCLNHLIINTKTNTNTDTNANIYLQNIGYPKKGTAGGLVKVCRKSCHNMSQSSNHPSTTKTERETTQITITSITRKETHWQHLSRVNQFVKISSIDNKN